MFQRAAIIRLLSLVTTAAYLCPLGFAQDVRNEPTQWAIVIHGGAMSGRNLTDDDRRARERSLRAAVESGKKILAEGGSSLDAVERVIRHLEDDPQFNAGKGAVFNSAGGHELDASIMDGRTRACGAVAGVTTVKNPISLARLVMERSRHVLFAGDGAERFAREQEVETVEQAYFSTEHQREALLRAQQRDMDRENNGEGRHMGTVGCAALDRHGNLAAGTSTGGLTNKSYGRVGDSPIIAAGTYADNATCAVSCTGIGEEFIRHAVSYDVSARLKYKGQSLDEAVNSVLTETLKKGDGGIIAVSSTGEITMQFNTPGMARAAADSRGRLEVTVGE